ncbi:hypothetical protein AB835_09250 [Candidatus Endobugula sertula]|uniref:Teneurin-like YD-shell domain-containing protein n=1 Tax=Candidatus Endobugula sertula TaxID=62101 RepID=A0A1D2QP39_9GAMM|nr:hypothetical protein AB835_09250 [Candidatus Endobugula sertula]
MTYCPLSNTDHCQWDPKVPFIKYPLKKVHYSRDGSESFTKDYTYHALSSPLGSGKLIVKQQESDSYGQSLLKHHQYTYHQDPQQFGFGYLKREKISADKQQMSSDWTYAQQGDGAYTIQETEQDGSSITRTLSRYYRHQQLLSLVRSQGGKTSHQYDTFGRSINKTLELGDHSTHKVTQYVNNMSGHYREIVHSNGYREKVEYDGLHRKIADYAWQNNRYVQTGQYHYNIAGHLQSKTLYNTENGEAYPLTTHYEYDIFGRKTRITNPLGVQHIIHYDDVLNQVSHTHQSTDGQFLARKTTTKNNQNKTVSVLQYDKHHQVYHQQHFQYDGLDRVSSKTVNGKTSHMTYQVNQHQQTTISPVGTQTTVQWHPILKKKPVKIWLNGQNLGTLEYDTLGNVIAYTNPEGYQKTAKHNGAQIQEQSDAIDNRVVYHYNNLLLTEKHYNGQEDFRQHSYLYNEYNRLSQVNTPNQTTFYHYTPDGKLKEKRDRYTLNQHLPDYTLSHVYDRLRQPVQVSDNQGNQLRSVRNTHGQRVAIQYNGQPLYHFDYDTFGRLSAYTRGSVKTEYEYDEFSRKVKVRHSDGDIEQESYEIDYNTDHQIIQITTRKAHYSHQLIEKYDYDKANRLISYDCSGPCSLISAHYAYDLNNNMIRARIREADGTERVDSYHYDNRNPVKLTQVNHHTEGWKALVYNANGQLTQYGDYTYQYNARGKLANTYNRRTNKTVNYHYNSAGHIISQQVGKNAPEVNYYHGNALIYQRQGEQSRFSVDKRQQVVISPSGCITYRLYSPVNNISAEKCNTEWAAYSYRPFGQQHVELGQPGRLGFQGNPHDDVTGDVWFGRGTRGYSPELRRFTTMDSLSPFGKGGFNGYTYGLNNPINTTDPSGHFVVALLLTLMDVVAAVGEELADMALGAGAAGENAASTELVGGGAAEATSQAARGTAATNGVDPYYRPDLYQRLESINELRPRQTSEARRTTLRYPNPNSYDYTTHSAQNDYDFSNTYSRDRITFISNRRHPRVTIHATDATRVQFLQAAQELGHYGMMPRQFVRSNVLNEGVISVIQSYESGSEEFLQAFLRNTDNGRSSWRIANEFGMNIDSATHEFGNVTMELSPKLDPGPLQHSLPPRGALPNMEEGRMSPLPGTPPPPYGDVIILPH